MGIAYALISDITVGVATTSISFSGLNITKDDDYLLVTDIINSTATPSDYRIFINNNITTTNYYTQQYYAKSTSIASSRVNSSVFMGNDQSKKGSSFVKIKLCNSGYTVIQSEINRNYGESSNFTQNEHIVSTFTSSSITDITVTSTNSLSISVGSRFMLYKLVATKVSDIIIGSAVTNIDITGLEIYKNSEYMLVSDISNSSATDASYRLLINGNTTVTNYYMQYLSSSSTSTSSGRANYPEFSWSPSGYRSSALTRLKLSNSGYFTAFSEITRKYNSTTLEIQSEILSSTFTSTNITQIRISSTITNGIGIGSRFQLYKLK